MIDRTLTIPKDHPHFEGHFPGAPVLPAVSQINLVWDALQENLEGSLKLIAIRRAKFRAMLKPDQVVQLEVRALSPRAEIEETGVRWVLRDDAQIYSMGEIWFRSPSVEP